MGSFGEAASVGDASPWGGGLSPSSLGGESEFTTHPEERKMTMAADPVASAVFLSALGGEVLLEVNGFHFSDSFPCAPLGLADFI